MRLTNLAAFEHPAQVGCGLDLSRVRAHLVNALVKCNVGATKRVEGHGTNHVRGINQSFCGEQSQRPDSQHRLRAVDQRHSLFCLKN